MTRLPDLPRLTSTRPRARATLVAALLAAVLALGELGVLLPGAGVAVRCDVRVAPPDEPAETAGEAYF